MKLRSSNKNDQYKIADLATEENKPNKKKYIFNHFIEIIINL